jgi:pimeloyl-ACP methyl ester carboxylesterase
MAEFVEKTFTNRDGLKIYYRDYANAMSGKLPILMLTGAPDNARFYHRLALHVMPTRRVLVMDWRGHGRSSYDPQWQRYGYFTDRDDVIEFLESESLTKVVVLGTSMGGTVIVHLGEKRLDLLGAAIINDIGPVLGEKAKARLLHNNTLPIEFNSHLEAAQAMKERMGLGVKRTDAEWLELAHLWCRTREDGKVVPDTDPNFRLSIGTRHRPPDNWVQFEAMKSIPILIIRGEGSDLLEPETVAEMKRRKPDLETVTVPDRGHNPLLDEPAALAAIDSFLATAP